MTRKLTPVFACRQFISINIKNIYFFLKSNHLDVILTSNVKESCCRTHPGHRIQNVAPDGKRFSACPCPKTQDNRAAHYSRQSCKQLTVSLVICCWRYLQNIYLYFSYFSTPVFVKQPGEQETHGGEVSNPPFLSLCFPTDCISVYAIFCLDSRLVYIYASSEKNPQSSFFSPSLHVQKWRAAWRFKNTVTPR